MLLRSDRIALRALEPTDLENLYRWENDTALWSYGGTLSPFSKFVLTRYLNDTLQSDIYQTRQLRLMIDLQKQPIRAIGTVDLFDFDSHHRRAEVGILIDEPFRRNGYALETLHLVSDYAFNHLFIKQIYSYVATDNEASIALFEKAGFEAVGTIKSWQRCKNGYFDVCFLQKINDEQR